MGDTDFFVREEEESFVRGGWSQGAWQPVGVRWSGRRRQPGAWIATLFGRRFGPASAGFPTVAAAFTLREMDELTTEEICGRLGISQGNLFVMLHRARLALRRCLETSWFGRTPEDTAS
jgi:hypothetical protein